MPSGNNVFLIYDKHDQPLVEGIAVTLSEKFHMNSLQETWGTLRGKPWQQRLRDTLHVCGATIIFIGANTAAWMSPELWKAFDTQVRKRRYHAIVPVLLPGAPDWKELSLPPLLSRLTYIDLRRNLNDEDALWRIFCGVGRFKPGEIPPKSYMPYYRPRIFIGRQAEIEAIAHVLIRDEPTHDGFDCVVVTGIEGVGKTQLAVEFAYRYGYRFKGVHWVNVRDLRGLDASIAVCGRAMDYNSTDQRELVTETLTTWTTDGPRLLILDDFDNIDRAEDVLIRLRAPASKILITSSRVDFPRLPGIKVRALSPFTDAESLEFINKTFGRDTELASRKALAEGLGGLPLTLQIAFGDISHNKYQIDEYLQKFTAVLHRESIQAEYFKQLGNNSPTDAEKRLFASIQLTWRNVKDKVARTYFMISGYCASGVPIPLEVFMKVLSLHYHALHKTVNLLSYLELQFTFGGGEGTHRLVAAYARLLDSPTQEVLAMLVTTLLKEQWQLNEEEYEEGKLGWVRPLYPHILTVADLAQDTGLPEVISLLTKLAFYLHEQRDYEGARGAMQRAIKICNSCTADTLDNSTITTYKSFFGSDRADVDIILGSLGAVLQDLGDLPSAKLAYEGALKVDEAKYGAEHLNVAFHLKLGSVLQEQGDLNGTITAFERAAKILEDSKSRPRFRYH